MRGEAHVVENGIEKVAGTVACKRPAGAVGAVRTRSQPHDQHPGILIAERRNWLGPINPIPIGAALAGGDPFAILSQTAAAVTPNDSLVEKNERTGAGRYRTRIGRRQSAGASWVRWGMELIPDCKALRKDGVR